MYKRQLPAYLGAWTATLVLLFALSAPLRGFTGAGTWALRTVLTLAVAMVTLTSLVGLFSPGGQVIYGAGLVLVALIVGASASPVAFDLFGLSAGALGLNTLFVAGLARMLLEGNRHHEATLELLVLGLAAAGLLAVTVMGVMALARAHSPSGEIE